MTEKPIDTHAHLDRVSEDALARASAGGLGAVVGVGMDLVSNRRIMELAASLPKMVWPALGAHPWNLGPDWPENLAYIRANLSAAVAVGEVGLDYRVKVDKKLQQRVFAEVLSLAVSFAKPVLVHSRYSQERCLQMLLAGGVERAVFHWYSGPLDILDRILDAGYHISATPSLAASPPHRAALAHAPLNRILVETDAPEEHQGRASEPADALTTIDLLAELRGRPAEEIAALTTRNALQFFFLR